MTPAEITERTKRLQELASAYAGRVAIDHASGKVNQRKFQDAYHAFIAGYSAATDGSAKPEIVTKGGAS